MMTGWLGADGSALGEPKSLSGAPKTLGTPSGALTDNVGAPAMFHACNCAR